MKDSLVAVTVEKTPGLTWETGDHWAERGTGPVG